MMKSMQLQYSHILVKEHFLGSLPHGKHTTEMGKQCNVSSLLSEGTVIVSQSTNQCQRAPCTWPVAFTRSFQGDFLALETRWWWCSRCRSAADMTLEMLPHHRPRCSTVNYMGIFMGRPVRGQKQWRDPDAESLVCMQAITLVPRKGHLSAV